MKNTTSEDIRTGIMAHLVAYRESEEVEERESWDPEIAEVSRQQQDIGSNAFMEGLLAHRWEKL